MDQKYLDCFVESAGYTLPMFLGQDHSPLKIKQETLNTLPRDLNVHVMMGITGELFGSVILSLTEESSLRLAGAMMGGMTLTSHNDISYSAIKEIINISGGGAATRIYELGKQIDLTPPAIVTGDNVNIQLAFPLDCITFSLLDFDFRLSVSLKERQPRSVLIVDDSKLLRDSAMGELQLAGFNVVGSCGSGQECLDFLACHVPDIVLLDVQMPGMDGIEVLQQIRARSFPTRVVIFTVVGNEETIQRATAAGVDGYMLKPMNSALLTVLKNL